VWLLHRLIVVFLSFLSLFSYFLFAQLFFLMQPRPHTIVVSITTHMLFLFLCLIFSRLFFYFSQAGSIMCASWVNCRFFFFFSCTGDGVRTHKAAMVYCCFPCLCLTSYFLALTFLLILRLIVLSVFCCTLWQMVPTTGELCFLFFFLVAGVFLLLLMAVDYCFISHR